MTSTQHNCHTPTVSVNRALLSAVPASAQAILDIGCAEGNLESFLKRDNPSRVVYGVEKNPALAARASELLDRVFVLDVEEKDPPLEPACVDCIVYVARSTWP